MQPSIILLRQGTDVSQGKAQLISNINACEAVADAIRTTLGPSGMDKLVNSGGMSGATISNDGATILGLLDIVHPAARVMVDIAKAQDAEVGDGTTSVTLLASELLKESKQFVEDGEHPSTIIKGYRRACALVLNKLGELESGVNVDHTLRDILQICASTSLNSKLIARNKDFFSKMVVDAVLMLDQKQLDLDMVGIKKVTGGSVTDSFLVDGVAFKKTFSYAGFEQQPKRIENAKVLILQVELEHKSEKDNAEIRINDVAEYQRIVDAEWKIIYDKIDACSNSGANVVLSRLAIGDLATQKFADRGIFCAGRVQEEDLKRVALATGAKLQTTTRDLVNSNCLGFCGLFEERQVGGERYNILSQCKEAKSTTIVVRGGSEQFVEEAHRSLHDALMVVKRTIQSSKVVPGGGAVEMALATALRREAKSIAGKQQLVLEAFARALEVVPRTLCENAGFDPNDMVNLLKQKHNSSDVNAHQFGVNLDAGGVHNTFEMKIWEPAANKRNAIASASEAACVVLSIDETVRNPQSEQAQLDHRRAGAGGGAPVSQAMGGEGMRAMAPGVRTLQGKGGH